MKLILAQGNPGSNYAQTRHNISWMILDDFAQTHDAEFAHEKKFAADIAAVTIDGKKVLLAKPTTFYNGTGRAGRALVDFYKLDPASDVLVIHDDLALPFGTIRVRKRGSDGGNNGIKSLNAHLGPDYWRLRIGITSKRPALQSDVDYVLSRLTASELTHVHQHLAPATQQMIQQFCEDTLQPTSHQTIALK